MLSIGTIPRPVRGLAGDLRLNACVRPERLVHPDSNGLPGCLPRTLGQFDRCKTPDRRLTCRQDGWFGRASGESRLIQINWQSGPVVSGIQDFVHYAPLPRKLSGWAVQKSGVEVRLYW